MLAPSTLNERSTVGSANAAAARQPDYQSATAAAAVAAATGYDETNQYAQELPPHLQHHQQLLLQQLHYSQQHAAQAAAQQQLHYQQQQAQQAQVAAQQAQQQVHDYDESQNLRSKYVENEIVKTFSSKPQLVGFVKNVLCIEEQCKIVINSLKPKAIYFQCERSGSFRTTVKDALKRQRVAYTKRNKCGYRLVANLYPPEKDKKKLPKKLGLPDEDTKVGFERNLDDKLNDYDNNEMWILRMINPQHNHPPEPTTAGLKERKRRLRFSRRLVEKPIINNANYNPEIHHLKQEHHLHIPHHSDTPLVQDPAVIAAIELVPGPAAAAILHLQQHSVHHTPVDPNIDPNVDPSVLEHDHSHRQ